MLQKSGVFVLSLLLLISQVIANPTTIFASTDMTKPTIESIELNKEIVQAGSQLFINAKVVDIESGVNSVYIKIRKAIGGVETTLFLSYNAMSQSYEGIYNVPSHASNGEWEIFFIHATDHAGNESSTSLNDYFFTVEGGIDDNTKPTIISTNMDKELVEPGENVLIQVEAKDLESGIKTVYVKLRREGGGSVEKTIFLTYNAASQKFEGTYQVPLEAANGIWELYYIYISDKAGNRYNSTIYKDNVLHQAFTIIGGVDDTTKPIIKSTKLDKEIVEPGGQLRILVEAEDIESGIETAYVKLQKTGGGVERTVFLTYNMTTQKYEGIYTVPEDAVNGKWELFFIYASDNAGNKYYANTIIQRNELYQSFQIVKDIIPPDQPKVDEVNDKDYFVRGKSELSSSITVKVGTLVIGVGVANAEGNYGIWIPKQKAGTILAVTATDKAGNTSVVKEVTVKDVTAPSVPVVDKVTDKSIYVTGTSEVSSTISVKAGTTVLGTGETTSDGKYSVKISKQNSGTKITVTAIGKAGNVSEVKEIIVADATAPNVPTVNEVTDKSTIVTGTAEIESMITIKVGTTVIGTGNTTADGKYSVMISQSKAGTKLTVTATDKAGNTSVGKEVTVIDVTAPTVPVVNEVTDKSISVTGTAEVGSAVYIKLGTMVIGTGTTASDGKYSVTIPKQKAGTTLTVTAIDESGNASGIKEITVKDATAPMVPAVNEVTHKSTIVTGTAEAGSTVMIKVVSKILGTVIASTEGKFSLTIEKQEVGTVLNVAATDTSGNVSAEAKVTVIKAAEEETNRIAGIDRYETAVSISREGWSNAETVVLATGADFPDALAGGPLAYQENAPILLTKSAKLHDQTAQEIQRLKAKKVIILGSQGAVSKAVEEKLRNMGLEVERIGGENRFATAALIAKRLPSDQAVIAYGFNFPDALSISPYAAKNGIPILLTRSDRVPAETLSAVTGKVKTIVVGSTSVISESVVTKFPQPVRYGGATRYETGKEIITKLSMGTDNAYVATGANFPDALAGSVLAAKNDAPILLVTGKTIPKATNDLISKYASFTIFGSQGAVGDEVKKALDLDLKNN